MIALSIALAVVGLAALWTARDVALRLHHGSEARAALTEAKAAREAAEAASAEAAKRAAAMDALAEKMRAEHASMKARVVGMGGNGGRR